MDAAVWSAYQAEETGGIRAVERSHRSPIS
jgi:hypothetical protein